VCVPAGADDRGNASKIVKAIADARGRGDAQLAASRFGAAILVTHLTPNDLARVVAVLFSPTLFPGKALA
jgi:hypothetical protein